MKSPLDVQRGFADLQGQQIQNQQGMQSLQQNQQIMPLKIQQAQQDLQSGKLDMLKKKNDMITQALYGVVDDNTYQRAKAWAQANGLDTSRLPDQYDPQVIQQLRMGSLTANQYIQDQIKLANAGISAARQFGAQGGQQYMQGLPIGTMGPQMPQGSNMVGPPMPGQMQPPMQTLAERKMAQQQAYQNRSLDLRQQSIDNQSAMLGTNAKPEEIEAFAQKFASGDMTLPTSYSMGKSPELRKAVLRAMEINPGLDSNMTKNLQYWQTGKGGTAVKIFNVASNHLETLGSLVDALDNGDVTMLNAAANKWKQQTGQTAPNNFNAAKQIVMDEVVKAIVGGGGGVSDREEAAAKISAANSPAQLREVINTYKTLMGGQLEGLRDQFKYSTKRGDEEFNSILNPAAKKAMGVSDAPPGGKLIGTSGGKKVYQLPDGSHVMEQ
jgi:hypothetical protein